MMKEYGDRYIAGTDGPLGFWAEPSDGVFGSCKRLLTARGIQLQRDELMQALSVIEYNKAHVSWQA